MKRFGARLIYLVLCLLVLVVFPLTDSSLLGQDFKRCENAFSHALSTTRQVASYAGLISNNNCLNGQGLLENTPRFLNHTLSDMIDDSYRLPTSPVDELAAKTRLGIGGGLELLSYRIELVQFLVSVMLTSQEGARGIDPINFDQLFALDSPDEQQAWLQTYGGFAAIVIKADFLAGLIPYLVQDLLASDFQVPIDDGDVTIVLDVSNEFSSIDLESVFGRTLYLNRDDGARIIELFDINQVTINISQGPLDGSAEFDPTDWSLQRGEIGLNLDLGPNTISSRTVFSKGHGVERQILQLTAQVGGVGLLGEATFQEDTQEFKLQANVSDLLTLSTLTLLTPDGFTTPSIGFIYSIPIVKQD